MMIAEKIEVSDEARASGGFVDVRSGRYMGHLVAVKTTKVPAQHDLLQMRKVGTGAIILANRLNG